MKNSNVYNIIRNIIIRGQDMKIKQQSCPHVHLNGQTASCQEIKRRNPWPSSPEKPKQAGFSPDGFPLSGGGHWDPGLGSRAHHLRQSVQQPPNPLHPSGWWPCHGCQAQPTSSAISGRHFQASGQGTLRTQGRGLCSICWPQGRSLGTSQGRVLSPSDPHTWPVWPGHGHWVGCPSKGLPAVISMPSVLVT